MRTWGKATPPLLLSGPSPGRAFLSSVGPVLWGELSGLQVSALLPAGEGSFWC